MHISTTGYRAQSVVKSRLNSHDVCWSRLPNDVFRKTDTVRAEIVYRLSTEFPFVSLYRFDAGSFDRSLRFACR